MSGRGMFDMLDDAVRSAILVLQRYTCKEECHHFVEKSCMYSVNCISSYLFGTKFSCLSSTFVLATLFANLNFVMKEKRSS